MILDETAALLRRLYGKKLNGIRIERAVAGIYFSGVKLSDGSGGMASTPPDLKASRHQRHPPPLGGGAPGRKPPSGSVGGWPVGRLLDDDGPDPVLNSLKVAAITALSSRFLTARRYKLIRDRDALDLFAPGPANRVAMVGAFTSYIERLRAVRGLTLRVLELNKNALAADDRKFFVPADKAAEVLPASDTVIITGASITNGTVDALLSHLRPGARTAIVGPTGSFLPDAFFKKGVSMVSGAQILDPDLALDILSQGGHAHHLFGSCARKINLLPL